MTDDISESLAVRQNAPVNRLVELLTKRARARRKPHFTEHALQLKQVLYQRDSPIQTVHFPLCGVISVLTALDDQQAIETATIGSEGFAGLPLLHGVAHSPDRLICQVPGRSLCLTAAALADERKEATDWFYLLLRYAHFYTTMVAQTALCNRLHQIDARMCRWLLMTHDRVHADEFPLTQEFLAQMLGAARPSVNIANAALQRAGFIKYRRGRITILDRKGLESAACPCYERIAGALERMIEA